MMRHKFLPFHMPAIGEEEIQSVSETLRSGWVTTGPKVSEFEQEFAAFVGASAALALSSCSAALHTALLALGIGPGDDVITTAMTFCSSVHAIEHVGANPILVDVEPHTLTIDPAKVTEAVEKRQGGRVRAIMPVHFSGHPCDMDTILEVAQQNELPIVEDAAHALAARYKGRRVGDSLSVSSQPVVLTAFSFYATKNLTTAEGGMLTGASGRVDEARTWSLHGMNRDAWKRYSSEGSWYYEVIRPGFKYNMTDVQAAIGLHQLRKIPQFQARRLEIVRRYNEAFASFEELQTPTERPEVEHGWHLYVLRLNLESLTISRNQFIDELKSLNIGSSVHFIPIHLHPYYRDRYGYKSEDFPVAYREFQRILSLPLYPKMSDQDVQDVIDAVTDLLGRFRR